MHPSDTATTDTRPWQRDIGSWVLIAVIPGLAVSQWVALQAWPGARTLFNTLLLVAALVVLLTHYRRRVRRRWLIGSAIAVVIVLGLSTLVNQVFDLQVVAPGAVPYLFPLVVGVSSVLWRPRGSVLAVAFSVTTVVMVVLAVTALLQLILGETGFVITGQELEYPRWWERGRATGIVMNPGRLAHLGLIGLALAPTAGRWRWPLAITAGIAAAASGGRLVLLALIGLAVLTVVTRDWAGRRVMAAGLAITAVAFVAFQLIVPEARRDLNDRLDTALEEETIDVRAENLEASIDMLSDHLVLGAGPGRFGSTTAFATDSPLHDEYGLLDVRSEEFVEELRAQGDFREIDVGIAQLDIGLLQVATELGSLGLLSTVAFMSVFLWLSVRRHSLLAASLVLLIALFSLTGPGWVDIALVGTVLWWVGSGLDPEASI